MPWASSTSSHRRRPTTSRPTARIYLCCPCSTCRASPASTSPPAITSGSSCGRRSASPSSGPTCAASAAPPPGSSARWPASHALPEQPDDADNPLANVSMGPLVAEVDEFKRRFGVQVDRLRHDRDRRAARLRRLEPGQRHQLRPRARRRARLRGAGRRRGRQPVGPDEVGELDRAHRRAVDDERRLPPCPRKTARRGATAGSTPATASRYDADGNYYFVDRIKDAIRRRGENISSFEVEADVVEHPAVQSARRWRCRPSTPRTRSRCASCSAPTASSTPRS